MRLKQLFCHHKYDDIHMKINCIPQIRRDYQIIIEKRCVKCGKVVEKKYPHFDGMIFTDNEEERL